MKLVELQQATLKLESDRGMEAKFIGLVPSFIELAYLLITFAQKELYKDNKFKLPGVFNVFKWVRLGKFLIDVIRLIKCWINGGTCPVSDLSKPFIKTIELRDFQQNRIKGGTFTRLAIA